MSDPSNPVEINQEYGGTLEEPIVVGSQEHGGADNQGMHSFPIETNQEDAADFFGGNTQGEQNQDQGQHHHDQGGHHHDQGHHDQGYQEGGYDDFGQGQQDQGYYNQPQSGGHNTNQQANYDDDFFGGSQPAAQPLSGGHQNAPAYGGGYSGGMGMYGENYDPEEEERQEKLRRAEQERLRKLDEKAHQEREKKQEKISNAAKELAKWHSEREQNIEKRKQINKQNQELSKGSEGGEDYKNSWDKITGNIALKEGEYPGTKDVTRFRQALLNKKLDAGKGLNPELV